MISQRPNGETTTGMKDSQVSWMVEESLVGGLRPILAGQVSRVAPTTAPPLATPVNQLQLW
jgi:hypothetical protein